MKPKPLTLAHIGLIQENGLTLGNSVSLRKVESNSYFIFQFPNLINHHRDILSVI